MDCASILQGIRAVRSFTEQSKLYVIPLEIQRKDLYYKADSLSRQ